MKSVQLLLMFLFIVLAKACPSSKNEETSTKKNEGTSTKKNEDIIDGKLILKSPGVRQIVLTCHFLNKANF